MHGGKLRNLSLGSLIQFTLILNFAFSSEVDSRVSILDNLLFLLHEHIQVTNDS